MTILIANRSTEQNQHIITLLEDLKDRVTEQDRQLISDLLAQVRYNVQLSVSFHTMYSDKCEVVDDFPEALRHWTLRTPSTTIHKRKSINPLKWAPTER